MPSSRGSSQPRDQTLSLKETWQAGSLLQWPPGNVLIYHTFVMMPTRDLFTTMK